jgi:hypothetical protein
MRAFDVEGARTVRNHQRIVEIVAEFVIKVSAVGRVRRIHTGNIDDIEHTLGLPERSRRQQIGDTHGRRSSGFGAFVTHAIAGLFETRASGKICQVILAIALVHA